MTWIVLMLAVGILVYLRLPWFVQAVKFVARLAGMSLIMAVVGLGGAYIAGNYLLGLLGAFL